MQNILFAFSAIAPIFIQILLGFFLKKKKVIDQQFIDTASNFAFHYLFPFIVFRQIYKEDITTNINPVFIGYGSAVCILLGVLLCLIVPRVIKDRRTCGAFVQGSYRGNNVLMGVSLSLTVFGEAGSMPTVTLLPFALVILNIISLIALTAFSPDNKKVSLKSVVPEIVKNPIVIGAVAGIIVSLSGIRFPAFLDKVVNDLASMATPLALIALGGQLDVHNLFTNPGLIISATCIKLVVSPLFAIIPAMLFFHFNAYEMGALYFIFGSPSAVSSFIMAKAMKSDDNLAGQLVMYTTVFSSLTMFLSIFILKSLHVI